VTDEKDVRCIARALPEVTEATDHPLAFSVRAGKKDKGFVWAWAERVTPGKPRVHNLDVVAVRVPNVGEKELLLASDPDGEKFFTEPHYNGFPAVLVRLASVDMDELTELVTDAWRCQAPKKLVEQYDAASG
jgi:hypothetical protein